MLDFECWNYKKKLFMNFEILKIKIADVCKFWKLKRFRKLEIFKPAMSLQLLWYKGEGH